MKKIKKYLVLLILVVVSGFILSITYTFAKYVTNVVWDYYLESKEFYFSSDYLDTDDKETVNQFWLGEEIKLNLKNSQNDILVTDYDINYEVSCQILGDASIANKCVLNDTDKDNLNGVLSAYEGCINTKQDEVDVSSFNKTQCELEGYKWGKQTATKDLYVKIITTDENYDLNELSVEITAKSLSPYKKTISGKFILKNPLFNLVGINKEYIDYEDHGNLILSNIREDLKCINIKWDASKILIDENPDLFNNYKTTLNDKINEIETNINANTVINYKFYPLNNEEITKENFIINSCEIPLVEGLVAEIYPGEKISTLIGNPEWKSNNLTLNGINQGIEISDNSSYVNGVSLIAYFNPKSIVGTQNLIMKKNQDSNGYSMYLNNNILMIGVGNQAFSTSIIINQNEDYFITYTYSPDAKSKIYLNGELYQENQTGNLEEIVFSDQIPIKIGYDKDAIYQKNPLNGNIKAISIYNKALTAEEIEKIYLKKI